MLIVLFEGPDRTGKTNIAQELSRRIAVPYFKNDAEIKNFIDPKDYHVNTLKYADPYFISYLIQTRASVIIDRHYPSEWVYSKVFKRKTDMTALRRSDDAFAELGAKIVICRRTSYVGWSDDLFPEIIDQDKLKQIHDRYVEFASWTKCEVIWLDVDDQDLDRETNELMICLGFDPILHSDAGMCYDVAEDDADESFENEMEMDQHSCSSPIVLSDPDKDWSDVEWIDDK